MSAPDVSIRRLTATACVSPDTPELGARISRLQAGVAERRLDRALQSVSLPGGTWCLRRLDVPIQLDLTAPDPALEETWAAALATALADALRDPRRAIRFSGERAALVDLVAEIAAGRPERAWAWRQLGLLRPGDGDPGTAPREALLAAVTRRPEHAVGAIVLAVERVGLPAIHRIVGSSGWAAVARAVAQTIAASVLPSTAFDRPGGQFDATVRRLADRLVALSRLAAAIRRSSLRPDAITLNAWALLVATEADPAILRRRSIATVLAELAALLAPEAVAHPPVLRPPRGTDDHSEPNGPSMSSVNSGAEPMNRPTVPDPAPPSAGADLTARSSLEPGAGRNDVPDHVLVGIGEDPAGAKRDGPAGSARDRAPRPADDAFDALATDLATDRATAEHGYPTRWAGLMFMLATAPAAGVPETVLDEPAFAARTLPWVLRSVASGFGVPIGDPATAAFAGLDPGGELPRLVDEPATQAEQAAVEAVVRSWNVATAVVLGRTEDDPADVVAEVTYRRGVISYAPGWIDVRMPLGEVDPDLRRAGLDLDPGWVSWLGTVVRYVYE